MCKEHNENEVKKKLRNFCNTIGQRTERNNEINERRDRGPQENYNTQASCWEQTEKNQKPAMTERMSRR